MAFFQFYIIIIYGIYVCLPEWPCALTILSNCPQFSFIDDFLNTITQASYTNSVVYYSIDMVLILMWILLLLLLFMRNSVLFVVSRVWFFASFINAIFTWSMSYRTRPESLQWKWRQFKTMGRVLRKGEMKLLEEVYYRQYLTEKY